MRIRNYLVILIVLLLQVVKGQKLMDFKSYDTTVYIYSLDKEQMNFLMKNYNIVDTSFLFTHLHKKVSRNSNYTASLPYGNFIIATVDQARINYTYVNYTSFEVKHKIIDNDVVLFVKDKKSHANVSTATITINEMAVPFDEGYGGYAFNKNSVNAKLLAKNKVFLHVTLNNEYFVSHYNFSAATPVQTPRRSTYPSYQTLASSGYLIHDKPVYRPGDTLRLKAFLMDPLTGKPFKRRAQLTISESIQNFYFTKKLKAVSPGAFVFDWKIPDTLKIDRSFQLNVNYKKETNTFYTHSSFYLENYSLKANKYEAVLLKDEFYPGEDLTFRIHAVDVNRFPLQGTMVHYKLSISGVQNFYGDSLRLSEQKRLNFFERDTVYPYDNAMDIKIPSTIFPNMDATYALEVTLTDPSTFEQKVFNLYSARLMKKEKWMLYQQADSMFVRYLFNGKDSIKNYQILSMSSGDTLFKRNITTPYSFQLSPYTTQVFVQEGDNVLMSANVGFDRLSISKVKGQRSGDSIRISFSFPFEEAIHYRILKKDQVVQKGKTKQLDFRIADNSKDPYTILFTSNINNAIEYNYYRITYVPPLHKIKLQTNLPEQAFPGQKLMVTIQARDCYDKPLENINIAAYSVNKQFAERYVKPDIAVPEAFKDLVQLRQETSVDQVVLYTNNFQGSHHLSAKDFLRFDLYHNEYYQLRYPRGEKTTLKKKIQSPLPEFAITVTSGHQVYTPKYILLDGQPVYMTDLDAQPYSFQSKAGSHQITFRIFNKKITMNKVVLEASTKYWFCFNIDSLKTSGSQLTIVDSLSVAQPNETEKNLLYNSLLFTNQFSFDSLFVKSNQANIFTSHQREPRQVRSLNVDGDVFYVFGPITETENAKLRLNNKTFNLKVSSEYAHFYDPTTREFTSKFRGPIKGIIFGFTEMQISDYHLASLQVYDTVAQKPESVNLKYNAMANQALKQVQETEYTQNYANGGDGQFTIYFNNSDSKNYVKALWFINKLHPEQSAFAQITGRNDLIPYQKNGVEECYDIYFLMSNEKMVHLPGLCFNNGDNFYINPSLIQSEELTTNKLARALKIYTDLTRLPLLPFYFPPEESKDLINETRDLKRQNTYLHGIITDESLQPLANVMVLAEVNGKFVQGALTNQVGEYEMLDMLPGTYQLKFFHSAYQMKTLAPRFLKAGYTYELTTKLKDLNLQRPVLETVLNDFRFMIFNGDKQKGVMKINLFDKETREALRDYTLTLREENEVEEVKIIKAKANAELAFLQQTKVYKLEIACKGYAAVIFHNLRFCEDTYYALYLFMNADKENSPFNKKEYDLQMQYYPTEGGMKLLEEMMENNVGVYNSYASGASSNASHGSREEYQLAPPINVRGSRIQNAPASSAKIEDIVMAQSGVRLDEVEIANATIDANYAPEEMINQVINNTSLNTVRKNFSDVGYWQPNHITNKKGAVSFEIRLPDNITTWKSNILAMGKYHIHGIDTSETRAYKPLQVNGSVPSFLWMGDKVWTKARFSNLTKDPKTITTSLVIDNQEIKKNVTAVKNDYLDSVLLDAKLVQPLQFRAALQFEDKYKDEEQKEIQVYNPSFRFYANQNFSMEKDSTYQLTFKEGTKGEIILNNNLYEKIVEEINELGKYEYTCVEQTSSQLRALLCKERINKSLGAKENLNPKINRLIRQLENYQNKNGTWGWWKRQPVNWRMTIYALEALGKASNYGYHNNGFNKGVEALRESFAGLSTSDQLYAYWLMQDFGRADAQLKKIVEKINPNELAAIDKMYYYKIKEVEGEAVSSNALYSVYLEMSNQLVRPYYNDFFYDPKANLFSAYTIFSGSSSANEWLQVFKNKLSNGTLDKHLNTYSKLAMIESLTASTQNTDNKPLTAEVLINDTLQVKTFPFRLPVSRTKYHFKHKDAAVFVNTSEENFTDKPEKSDSLFKVSTYFLQNGKSSSELQAGIPCKMNVDIDAYRGFDYVMIEIPLPSGMRFVTKPQLPGCSIEYFNNKVVAFYQRLNMQQHHLSFDMMPVFRGSFVWPAAKCSLMYYPYLFGNNQLQTLGIK